ncbi:unnamed protein product [Mesocestoides corti]|uniref:Uncharacterized protein n=2 Tax=Mesocestoides corti TaxID=53468 RepID=A0A0R3UEE5_MESCO|nr:unnamed protein product [Mesocestoides corti]
MHRIASGCRSASKTSLFIGGSTKPLLIASQRTSFYEVDRAGGRNKGDKIEGLVRWWLRLKPWNEEIANLKRRLRRSNAGFDPCVHGQTRFLVRFPQLTDSDFKLWSVYTDADFDEGYSSAEFVRSNRDAVGPASGKGEPHNVPPDFLGSRTSGDEKKPLSPREKDSHPFSIMYSADRVKWYLDTFFRRGQKTCDKCGGPVMVTSVKACRLNVPEWRISTLSPESMALRKIGGVNGVITALYTFVNANILVLLVDTSSDGGGGGLYFEHELTVLLTGVVMNEANCGFVQFSHGGENFRLTDSRDTNIPPANLSILWSVSVTNKEKTKCTRSGSRIKAPFDAVIGLALRLCNSSTHPNPNGTLAILRH